MHLWLALGGALARADPDEDRVAAALSRRAAALDGAGCPGSTGHEALAEAASELHTSVTGTPVDRAHAIYVAFTAIVAADARSKACAKEPSSAPGDGRRVLFYRQLVSPHDINAAGERIRRWGEVEAAGAWRRLAKVAATPRKEAREPEVCRCMGEPRWGTAVAYGYPNAAMELEELLGVVTLGGCDPAAGGPLACPLGCWADRRRVGDDLPAPRRAASRSAAGLLLGVAGVDAAVADWDTSAAAGADMGTLQACMGNLSFGQAFQKDGVWAAATHRASDRCLAAWADEHVHSGQIDRAAVMRQ